MEHEPADEQWVLEVLALLEDPLRSAGMGSPDVSGRHVMWHRDPFRSQRPCPDSPVWRNSPGACYDVTVTEETDVDGTATLRFFTEGTDLIEQPAPATTAALAAVLRPLAQDIHEIIRRDFQLFETENHGCLPGAEFRTIPEDSNVST